MNSPGGARIGGIDAPLPPGEAIRWEGRPVWRALFWRAFHGRTVTAYFAVLALYQVGAAATGAKTWSAAVGALVVLTMLAVVSLGCSALLSWLSVRSTVYAITDRRLVLKVGIVIPSTINIPFRLVESVAMKPFGQDQGDLAVQLADTERIAFIQLWPHVRPWRLERPEPSLRAVPEMSRVGSILQQALADAHEPGTFGPGAPSRDLSPNPSSQRAMTLGSVNPATAGLPR